MSDLGQEEGSKRGASKSPTGGFGGFKEASTGNHGQGENGGKHLAVMWGIVIYHPSFGHYGH